MLRYVEMEIPGGLAFRDDPTLSRERGGDLLADFLALGRRGLANPGRSAGARDFASFAREHGSLLEPACTVPVPAGAGAMLDDLDAAFAAGAARAVAVEEESTWGFHLDCMLDIALLHHAIRRTPPRGLLAAARVLRGNMVVYEAPGGGRECLYHGTNGLLMPPSAPATAPADVAAYLSATGAGWCFSAPWEQDGDGLGQRGEWLALHGREILSGYLDRYLSWFAPGRPCLLGDLHGMLAELAAGDDPLQFCVVCGAPAPPSFFGESQHFDRGACRSAFYRCRDDMARRLVEECGFSQGEAEAMLDTSRGTYR